MTSEWIEYVPLIEGAPPPNLPPGAKLEILISSALTPPGQWTPLTFDPGWNRGTHYRFRNPQPSPNALPEDDSSRLEYPMFDGLMAYFPNALAEVSQVSKIGNDQHNPGQPMHWARGKSTDHENKIMRHLVDVGRKDARGVRHSARLAWRALALLQEEIEREDGVPMSRGSKTA